MTQEHASCHAPSSRWYRDPWVWGPVSGVLLATAGRWWPAAASVSAVYVGYLRKVWAPLLLGLSIGGVIDYAVPKVYIVKFLSGRHPRVVLRSTLLGFLASSCSHGCLALSLELYRKGASIPAVVSFLLASPWASMSLTFLLLSLFGLRGIVIVTGALAVAGVTGLVFQQLERRQLLETNPHTVEVDEHFSIRRDLQRRLREHRWNAAQWRADAAGVCRGMIPLGRMVLGWVQLGLILSAVLGGVVPHTTFMTWLGPTGGGLLLTLAVAAVLEVCSEGTAPVAFELYRHTGALGNAFAFLMGGVVTDYTELGALWTTIGRKTVLWMVAVTLPLVIGIGWWLNGWK